MTKTKRLLRAAASALLVFALLVTGLPFSGQDATLSVSAADKKLSDMQKEFDQMEKDLKNLKNDLKKLQNQEADCIRQVSNYNEQIELVEEQITSVEEQIKLLDADIAQREEDIADLDSDIADLEEQIVENRERFKERLRAFYLNGEAGELEILLGSENFADFLNRYTVVRAVADRDKAFMDDLRAQIQQQENLLASFHEMKTALEEQSEEAREVREQLDAKKKELKSMKSASQKLLDSVKNDEKAKQKAIKTLNADMDALEKEIEEATRNSTGTFGGKFVWPCPGYSRISCKFGYRYHPITGEYKLHKGVDLAAAKNTPILAAADGKVTTAWATEHGSYGKYVIIDHGGGYVTLYAHCNSVSVKAGDKVKQGQEIAKVGTTGSSTGYHLHFEIRENGNYVDPLNYFPDKK